MMKKLISIVEKIANQRLRHSQDKEGDYGSRLLIHALLIQLLLLLVYAHWSLALGWIWLFIKYERNEDAHTEDQAWKDIAGGLAGLPIVAAEICILIYGFDIVPWYIP